MGDRPLHVADRPQDRWQPGTTAVRWQEPATIGFLTANIHIGVSRRLWRGVVDAAAQHGVNLLCLPGGGLDAAGGFEAQRNIVYDLISPAQFSGLVSWSSTITGSFEASAIETFHQRYRSVPLVSLTQPLEAVPTLSVDSYQGMREALVHLIEVHGYRRLAFLRGPEGHYYAQERYQAYLDVLQQYGLPRIPELISEPMHWEAGAQAIERLLDQGALRPGIDLQAIVAVSDLLALAAMKTLQARGIHIPRQIAVVGVNDSMEGRLATPPLTSVTMPFYEQGARAVDVLLSSGDDLRELPRVMLQSQLVVRQSCGCPSRAVVRAGGPPQAQADAAQLLAELRRALLDEASRLRLLPEKLEAGLEQVVEALRLDLNSGRGRRFLAALEGLLEQVLEAGGDVAAWQDAISLLRQHLLPTIEAPEHAEGLFGQARVLIGEVAQRAQGYRKLQADRQSANLSAIGQALITTFDVETLCAVLAERLPTLGITSCYLALYEDPAAPRERSRLVLGYSEQGRLRLPPGGLRFPSRELVPSDLLPRGRRYSMVVEPLYFRDDQLGFVLFEIGPRDPSIYETLRGYISSALKGALLVHEAQQARLAAEKADRIKTRLLANVSHELRTPLHIILEQTRSALSADTAEGQLAHALQHIRQSAEHQLRLINDLLDLSRAEIGELDLYPELVDPRPILEETFHSFAAHAALDQAVAWNLALPERLPWLQVDAVRLRQILLNLLANAQKFTERGQIALGAAVAPPYLHIWVADTGVGIPVEQQERIFEPFVTLEQRHTLQASGIGLGLSITRRLVALHRGTLTVEAQPGSGSTFHVYLPLPSLSEQPTTTADHQQRVLLVISSCGQPAEEIRSLSERQALEIRLLQPGDAIEAAISAGQPAALAWDLAGASPNEWLVVRRLRQHPRLAHLPFIAYGQAQPGGAAVGLTSFVVKPASAQTLVEIISAACPVRSTGPILIVDDDPQARARHQELVASGLPGYPIRSAHDGAAALALMAQEVPSLVLLDLVMPGLQGSDVLDEMRSDPQLRQVPVVVLSNKLLSFDDIKRLQQHAHVLLQSKGLLSRDETIALLQRALFEDDPLPPYTSALVKQAVAFLHQNYARPIARWELAQAAGVSEDYLSRVFSREIGLSPWEYLNRYRIYHARELLLRTSATISTVAKQVGFQDQRYFSRVFRKLTGVGPQHFREHAER